MRKTWLVVFEGGNGVDEPHSISSAIAADSFDGCSVVPDDEYPVVFGSNTARDALAAVDKHQQFTVMRMSPRDAQRIMDARVLEDYHIVACHSI